MLYIFLTHLMFQLFVIFRLLLASTLIIEVCIEKVKIWKMFVYVFIVFVSNVFFSYHIIKNVITNENFSCRCFMDRLSLFLFRVNDHKVNGCNVDWDSDPDPDFNSYLFPISKPLFTFLNKLLKKSFENNRLSVK